MNPQQLYPLASSASLNFEELPEALQELLAEAVDRYVIELEEGRRPDRQLFLNEYPTISTQLSAYLNQIDWLQAESRDASESSPSSKAHVLSETEFSAGLSYDDFEIKEELGRGAMGIVYRAFQKSLRRWVAVKVLPYGSGLEEQRTHRFWREAKITAALQHPGIVSVFGVGKHREMCFYAMSLVEGKSLDAHLAQAEAIAQSHPHTDRSQLGELAPQNPLLGSQRFRRIAQLIGEAAEAIASAHAVGVIHRDIKPSNLIVDAQQRAKVTDFGLAMDTGDLELTRSGEVVGTIRYMSPEQAAGKRGLIDQRSDVYCLGATLYELLTLSPPFDSDSLPEVVRQKESGLLKPPRSHDASIPRPLQTIALKAMRASPSDRYQTASQMANDLRMYLSGKAIAATDRSLVELIVDWSRRNTGILLTGLISLTLLFGLAVVFNLAQSSQRLALKRALSEREQHYLNAREAVDQLGIHFAEKLESIPEAAELRRDLLRQSLGYYSAFLTEAQHDLHLSRDVAQAKWKVAQATAALESIDQAEQAYDEADREFTRLIQTEPVTLGMRAEMLSDWAMKYMGGYQGEARSPEKALAILNRISADEAQLPTTTRALLKNNRAYVLAATDRNFEAVQSATAAVQLLRQPGERGIEDPASLTSLAVSMLNLSQVLDQAGQGATAIEVSQECDQLIERMEARHEADHSAKLQLKAKALATLAHLQWKHAGARQAIAGLDAVASLRAELLKSVPTSIEFRWDLAIALNNLGMALSAIDESDRTTDARQAFEKAYAIALAETQADPQNSNAAHRAANIQNNLGLLLRRTGHRPEADAILESAVAHIDRAFALDSNNDGIVKARERIHQNLLSASARPTQD